MPRCSGAGVRRRSRPVLAAALDELSAGRADALIATKLDRVARNLRDFLALDARARAEGCSLVVLDLDSTSIRAMPRAGWGQSLLKGRPVGLNPQCRRLARTGTGSAGQNGLSRRARSGWQAGVPGRVHKRADHQQRNEVPNRSAGWGFSRASWSAR